MLARDATSVPRSAIIPKPCVGCDPVSRSAGRGCRPDPTIVVRSAAIRMGGSVPALRQQSRATATDVAPLGTRRGVAFYAERLAAWAVGKKCSPRTGRAAGEFENPAFTVSDAWSAGQSRNRCLPWLPRVPWLPMPSPGNRSRVPGGPHRRHGWVSYPPSVPFPLTKFWSGIASRP